MSMSKLVEQQKCTNNEGTINAFKGDENTEGREVVVEVEGDDRSGSDEGKKKKKKIVRRVKANKKLLFKPL